MNITIGIVAYNEEKYLPSILEDITKQNYPHENIEIVLADSMSEDQTPKIMLQWQQQYQQQFYDIKVIENKGKIQSCGWNAIIFIIINKGVQIWINFGECSMSR